MSLVYAILLAMSLCAASLVMYLVGMASLAMSSIYAAFEEMFLVYLAIHPIDRFLLGICCVPSAMLWVDYMQ